jgi:Tol biopolymer transport system component
LVPNDQNQAMDVFLRDMQTGVTELISVQDTANLPSSTPLGFSRIWPGSETVDGRTVVFSSSADEVLAADTNAKGDIFVRNLETGTGYLASVSTNGSGANGTSTHSWASADGRFVAFTSRADNLVPGDMNQCPDVFLRDTVAGTTALVSVTTNGASVDRGAECLGLSDDGRFVLFTSLGRNLDPLESTNLFTTYPKGLYIRDMVGGTTEVLTRGSELNWVAMTPDGRRVGCLGYLQGTSSLQRSLYVWATSPTSIIFSNKSVSIARPFSLSPDGRWLIYSSAAGLEQVDLASGTNLLLSANPARLRFSMSISSDSRFLVYPAIVPENGPASQVVLHDLQSGSNWVVSRSWSTGRPANGSCANLAISPDGRFVAYRSEADDLVPNDMNGRADVFLYDRINASTRLVSVNRFGTGSGNGDSTAPVFGRSGRKLYFHSAASDLVVRDYNDAIDVFSLSLPAAQLFSVAAYTDGEDRCLRWPVQPGKTYRIQFKNDLSEPNWQDLDGPRWIEGSTGYFRDLKPRQTQRFYRVASE